MKQLYKFLSVQFTLLVIASPAFAAGGGASTVGSSLERVVTSFKTFPTLFSTFAYLAGAFAVTWAIFSFRDYVESNGNNPPLSTAVKRMLMGGMFLALPAVADAAIETWIGNSTAKQGMLGADSCDASSGTLDAMAVCFISDVSEPISLLLSAFCYIGGIMLILLGISRVTRTYQEGARGPAGIGTIMTFLSGGALMSVGQMMSAFSTSIFGDATAAYNPIFTGKVGEALGNNADVVATTISALIAFIGIVGWIAFIRGWFVLRAVADGSQQASITQALTFLFGGALAVNIGDVVNAIAATVGGNIGISFT